MRECIAACVYMWFLNLFKVGHSGLHRCIQSHFMGLFHATRTSRWPDDFLTWPHHCGPRQITVFKGHFKRCSKKASRWGLENLVPPFILHLQSFSLIPSLFCDAWNVVQGFVKFCSRTDVCACEKWRVRIIFSSLFIRSQHISSLFRTSKLMHSMSLCSSHWELYFFIKKGSPRHPKQSFFHSLL